MLDKTNVPFRHDQPGYYALADIPQRRSVSEIAKSTGWWELDQIWKLYPGQFNVVTGIAGSGKSTFLLNLVCNVACEHGMKSFLYVPRSIR
jgi:predicted ATP-dependent serine protease